MGCSIVQWDQRGNTAFAPSGKRCASDVTVKGDALADYFEEPEEARPSEGLLAVPCVYWILCVFAAFTLLIAPPRIHTHTTPPRARRAYACTVASAASGAISSVRLARTLSPAASSSLPFVSGTHTKAKAKKAALSAA